MILFCWWVWELALDDGSDRGMFSPPRSCARAARKNNNTPHILFMIPHIMYHPSSFDIFKGTPQKIDIITFENCLISFPPPLLFGQVGSKMSFPHNVLVQIFGEGSSVELFWVDFEDDDIIPIQYINPIIMKENA